MRQVTCSEGNRTKPRVSTLGLVPSGRCALKETLDSGAIVAQKTPRARQPKENLFPVVLSFASSSEGLIYTIDRANETARLDPALLVSFGTRKQRKRLSPSPAHKLADGVRHFTYIVLRSVRHYAYFEGLSWGLEWKTPQNIKRKAVSRKTACDATFFVTAPTTA